MGETEQIQNWLSQLYDFRNQGMRITDVNPVSALADVIFDQIHTEEVTRDQLERALGYLGEFIWAEQCQNLRVQTGIATHEQSLPSLDHLDICRPLYRAVFTAHPVFALRADQSAQLCADAEKNRPAMPDGAYAPRQTVSLLDEHNEAITAISHARRSINKINEAVIEQRRIAGHKNWRLELPQMLGISSWVGYDLDGRADISWIDSFRLRLQEKALALKMYGDALADANVAEAEAVATALASEYEATTQDIRRFARIGEQGGDFASAVNMLTERKNKLVSSYAIADQLHDIASTLNDEDAVKIMVIAADIRTHGFAMAEIHLRINSVQLRNAMRPVDGKGISLTDGLVSTRSLIDRLSTRITTEQPWTINFKNLENETATARRQLMLAAQFLKHIDCDQPIRLLIAECEKPITLMSALYLAHKMNIADKLDISPLFETSYGLEHGEQVIDQLLAHQVYVDYVRRRGRLAIQTGFSDAGRFIGQIAANLAIERLQVKITQCLKARVGPDITLLLFNTHGESLGRGGTQTGMVERQNFILTPFVRERARQTGISIYHQSSFQGGDGYRLFGTQDLSDATMRNLFLAELAPIGENWRSDPFYQRTDFSLDMFLSLKNWHETLFSDPAYSDLLDVFSNNLLPKTGSRPTKRVVQAGSERRDPSKMRAIPHNATLQQLGFLANVISGMGRSAHIDIEQFLDVYKRSPRLQQCLDHVRSAKALGSLNTVLAYCRIVDPGFWVNRAYHGKQHSNQRGFRKLSQHLRDDTKATGIRHTVWRLRDDLVDLYRLAERIDEEAIRTTGQERAELDLLHAIRIAVIIDSLVLISRTPNLAESNQYSNADILALGLRLDFEEAALIIRSAFASGTASPNEGLLSEPENYSASNTGNFSIVEDRILRPLAHNKAIILTITQMISAHYGAHG